MGSDAALSISDPSEINGLILWLDASDSSTIDTVSTKVSEWRDKSGQGNVLVQGTDASRPTLSTDQQNGLNGLSFSGSNVLTDASPAASMSGGFDPEIGVFAVAGNDNTSSTRMIVSVWDDTAGENSFALGKSVLEQGIFVISQTGSDQSNWQTVGADLGNSDVATFIGGELALAEKNTYLNRVKYRDNAGTADGPVPSTAPLCIGDVNDNATYAFAPWSGHIYEIVIYNRWITTAERVALTNHLYEKWGL